MEFLVSFIILAWNSERFIENCFFSIQKKCTEEYINFEIFVVDNGSSDRTRGILAANKDKIGAILLDKNYGTSFPRNLALKEAKGNIICFLDSDTVIKEGSISTICEKLLSCKEIGIIAPKIVNYDGSIQRSIKKFPSLLHKLARLKKIFFQIDPNYNEYYNEIPITKEITVDSAISACWFFRRELIQTVGLLDEKIFYSPEDLDYCLRVWKSGESILYYPFLKVLHHLQKISYKKKLSLISWFHFMGLLYFFKKHKYLLNAPKFGEWEAS